MTLDQLFSKLDGRSFGNRMDLETAVLEIFNDHVAEFPVGYSYKDAIEGARRRKWLITNPPHPGVKVLLSKHEELAGAGAR